MLNYFKADGNFRYVSLGVDIQEFFSPFKGTFQGRSYYSPIPPRIVPPNARNCQDHEDFISNCIYERVRSGSLLVVGKVGLVDPPYLVMPATIEPAQPRLCHDERFLNLWIKDCPFTLDYITCLAMSDTTTSSLLSTIRAATIIFLYTPPVTLFSVYNGQVIILLTPPTLSGRRAVRTYTTLLAWLLLAT